MSTRRQHNFDTRSWWMSTLWPFKLRLVLVPFAIISHRYRIMDATSSIKYTQFRYSDVFIFGVRVSRFQHQPLT